MDDEIFGKLKHKYNLYKYENITLFGKNRDVKIVVEYDEGDNILHQQQQNYQTYLKYIEENKEKLISEIKKYFKEVYNRDIDINKELIPTTIYFSKDGSWGILFDTEIDEENGFSFFVIDGKLHLGTQDSFI